MALSEHEQRMLDELEKSLQSDGSSDASGMPKAERGVPGASRLRGARSGFPWLAILMGLVGIGLVVTAVVTQLIWLGGLGFAAMVLGLAIFLNPAGERTGGSAGRGKPGKRGKPSSGPRGSGPGAMGDSGPGGRSRNRGSSGTQGGSQRPFMQRMEQRWENRRGREH